MIGQVLRDTIIELSVPQTEVKLILKALTTIVNEHLFAKARKLGINEAVGCLEFAINFPSIVEEVMKRITELPFLFYTHPKSYYEIPQDFIKFEDMPSIPKPSHVPLPPQDVAKLHDYKKKWLEAVRRVSNVRSDTTKRKFSTLPMAFTNQSHLRTLILISCPSFEEKPTSRLQRRK